MDRFIKLHNINNAAILFNTRHITRIDTGVGLSKGQTYVYCNDDVLRVMESLEEIESILEEK